MLGCCSGMCGTCGYGPFLAVDLSKEKKKKEKK
jgi:hypothetical protein